MKYWGLSDGTIRDKRRKLIRDFNRIRIFGLIVAALVVIMSLVRVL